MDASFMCEDPERAAMNRIMVELGTRAESYIQTRNYRSAPTDCVLADVDADVTMKSWESQLWNISPRGGGSI